MYPIRKLGEGVLPQHQIGIAASPLGICQIGGVHLACDLLLVPPLVSDSTSQIGLRFRVFSRKGCDAEVQDVGDKGYQIGVLRKCHIMPLPFDQI